MRRSRFSVTNLPVGSPPRRGAGDRGPRCSPGILASLGTILTLLLLFVTAPAAAQGLRDDGPVVAPVELHNPHYSLRDFDEGSERILGEVLRSHGIRALRSAVVSAAVVGEQIQVTTVPYDPRVAQELGKETQADYVISGALEEYGEGTIRILLVIVDVDTGEIVLEDQLSAPSSATGRRGWEAPLRALLEFHGPELADVFQADFEMVLDRRARIAAQEEAERRAEEQIESRRRELEFELLEAEIALKRSERRGADAYRVRQEAEARRAAAEQALAGLRQETAIAERDAAAAARDAFEAQEIAEQERARAERIRGRSEMFRAYAEAARLDAPQAQQLAATKVRATMNGVIPGSTRTEAGRAYYSVTIDRVVVRPPTEASSGDAFDLKLLFLAVLPRKQPQEMEVVFEPPRGTRRETFDIPAMLFSQGMIVPAPSDEETLELFILGFDASGLEGSIDDRLEYLMALILGDMYRILAAEDRAYFGRLMNASNDTNRSARSAFERSVIGRIEISIDGSLRTQTLEAVDGNLWVRLRFEAL